jgi:hypothetical protein
MAYASKAGRARISAKKPQAFGVCYRCGIWENRVNLQFQYEWRGTALVNLYILVCRRCLDIPQEQLRAIQLPADPVPIYFPSVEDFSGDETNYRSTVPGTIDPITGVPMPSNTLRVTQDCQNRVTQQIGAPVGLIQNAVMSYNGAIQKAFGTPVALLSVTANGTATIAVTCSAPHGLETDDQIAVEGLSARNANGFYSVTVITTMAFSYQTYSDIASGGLLTPTTRMVTCLVGLPYGAQQIPQVGP